jgi:acetyl-CoA carboxylase carboxyl transferase subunit beta
MQEGTFSLMQLVKTVGAIERLRAAGVPFLSLLSDPTTGGVFASFAVLGDVNIAEPNALIGFAGARVSAGTIAQELPPGFQRSEFLFEHGYLDRVIHRSELRSEISALLRYLVAPPVPIAVDRPDGDPLGLPSFRPLSFLSNLAERVLPPESEAGDTTNGHGASPAAPEPSRPTPEPSRPALDTEDPGRG